MPHSSKICVCPIPPKQHSLNNSTVQRQFSQKRRMSMRLRTGLKLR